MTDTPERVECPDCGGMGRVSREIPDVPPEVCVASSPCETCWPRWPDGSLKAWDDGTAGTIPARARYGEVIYERPSPDELEEAGRRVAIIRDNISVLRGEVEQLERGWAPLAGDDKRFRDVQGLLTAALVMLHESEVQFPKWAKVKRAKLAHPETYVVTEGFNDERREKGMVEVWWWDKYHQDFGPHLRPMPWTMKEDA